MKNKIITAILTVLLTFSIGITPVLAAPSQSEVKKAEQEFEQLTKQLDEADAKLQAQTDAVEKTSYQIEQKQEEINKLNKELDQKRSVLAGRMRSTYKHGKTSLFSVFLGSASIEDLVSRIYYLDRISSEDEKSIDSVTTLEQKLNDEKSDLEKTKAVQDQKAQAIADQAKDYQAKVKKAQDYYNSLDAQLKEEIKKQAEAKVEAEQAQLDTEQEHSNKPVSNHSLSNAVNDIINPVQPVTPTKPTKPTSKPSDKPAVKPTNPSKPSGGGLATAYSCIGKPYVSGAAGPNSFDCSGLICYCYGYKRGRTTGAMISSLKASGDWKSNVSELNVGDLVFTGYGHVGIYVGNYRFIHSPRPGRVVCEQTMWSCIGGGRY